MWTASISAREYSAFLWELLHRVACRDENGQYVWKEDDKIEFGQYTPRVNGDPVDKTGNGEDGDDEGGDDEGGDDEGGDDEGGDDEAVGELSAPLSKGCAFMRRGSLVGIRRASLSMAGQSAAIPPALAGPTSAPTDGRDHSTAHSCGLYCDPRRDSLKEGLASSGSHATSTRSSSDASSHGRLVSELGSQAGAPAAASGRDEDLSTKSSTKRHGDVQQLSLPPVPPLSHRWQLLHSRVASSPDRPPWCPSTVACASKFSYLAWGASDTLAAVESAQPKAPSPRPAAPPPFRHPLPGATLSHPVFLSNGYNEMLPTFCGRPFNAPGTSSSEAWAWIPPGFVDDAWRQVPSCVEPGAPPRVQFRDVGQCQQANMEQPGTVVHHAGHLPWATPRLANCSRGASPVDLEAVQKPPHLHALQPRPRRITRPSPPPPVCSIVAVELKREWRAASQRGQPRMPLPARRPKAGLALPVVPVPISASSRTSEALPKPHGRLPPSELLEAAMREVEQERLARSVHQAADASDRCAKVLAVTIVSSPPPPPLRPPPPPPPPPPPSPRGLADDPTVDARPIAAVAAAAGPTAAGPTAAAAAAAAAAEAHPFEGRALAVTPMPAALLPTQHHIPAHTKYSQRQQTVNLICDPARYTPAVTAWHANTALAYVQRKGKRAPDRYSLSADAPDRLAELHVQQRQLSIKIVWPERGDIDEASRKREPAAPKFGLDMHTSALRFGGALPVPPPNIRNARLPIGHMLPFVLRDACFGGAQRGMVPRT